MGRFTPNANRVRFPSARPSRAPVDNRPTVFNDEIAAGRETEITLDSFDYPVIAYQDALRGDQHLLVPRYETYNDFLPIAGHQ